MGKRLLTNSPRTNAKGQMLVSFAANRTDGVQTGNITFGGREECVPFNGGTVLGDRKHLVLTDTSQGVFIGSDGVTTGQGYFMPGPARGDDDLPPDTAKFSNRKQFLRGQHLSLSLLTAVEVCTKTGGQVETMSSFELS